MTATAPDSSAMRACSTFMTSMMTPPFEHLGQAYFETQAGAGAGSGKGSILIRFCHDYCLASLQKY